ncbi:MAG: sigma-54 dependent transcriptional regulator [Gammaproteobacteria bacterium]|nr:sigma-54 dependent transcriptional regulator [Gammaproteobacteria bacterium]
MSGTGPVFLVDDEKHIRVAGAQMLELAGYDVRAFQSPTQVLPLLDPDWSGVVISDIKMPDMDGLEFLTRALEVDPDLPVILVTGHGDINMAVNAIRDGAYDFLEKPFASEHLSDVVRRAMEKRALTLENRSLRRELQTQGAEATRLVGDAPRMLRLRNLIGQIADTDADVLVLGETGTGKELVARSLHEQSSRRAHNFVAVNCGALPESMIESELFGHEAGAFTGAQKRRIGKFEHANGGTLFLDEIENMPMPLQTRLLRALQERAIERLGSNELIPLDLRVIAATKVDLQEASAVGGFREDLYYRLNVVTLEIPPLRERSDDIPLLFQHFVQLAALRYRREPRLPTPARMQQLRCHAWPGNVRELRNCAERYLLLGDCAPQQIGEDTETWDTDGVSLPEQVERFERSLIDQALARHKGRIKETLETLGLPRKTLYDKMRKHGLDRHDYL